jgi:hypothetical protein
MKLFYAFFVRRNARRRRLLKACQWHARNLDVRDHVRKIEHVLDERKGAMKR